MMSDFETPKVHQRATSVRQKERALITVLAATRQPHLRGLRGRTSVYIEIELCQSL